MQLGIHGKKYGIKNATNVVGTYMLISLANVGLAKFSLIT
jgi:hypothetical protein